MTTNLELNSIAGGIFKYLSEKTESPIDGLFVLGIAICIVFDKTNNGKMSFQDFVDNFRTSLIATHADTSAVGTERIQ